MSLVLLAIAAVPLRLEANGGTLRLSRAVAGPYLVSAWTQPDPPRVGAVDLSVAVMSPATGEAILEAEARAAAEPAGSTGAAVSTTLARGAGGNLLLHHGILDVPAVGAWRVAVQVIGPAGPGEVAFTLDVGPPLPVTVSVVIGIAVLAFGGLVWWVRTKRRPSR